MTTTETFALGQAPDPLPLIGHLVSLARRPLEFLSSLRDHGDLVEIRIGTKKAYVVLHPRLTTQVLRDAATFDKGGFAYDNARQVFGNGLATCDWEFHQPLRRLVQPAFTRARLAMYTTVMRSEVDALVGAWQPGQVLDVKHVMDELFARITGRALFTASLGAAAVAEIQRSLPVIANGVFIRMMDPTGLLGRFGGGRFRRAQSRLYGVVDDVIRLYRDAGAADHGDVLSMLLATRDESGAGLTDQEIREQVLTVLTGGTETTSTAMSWAMLLLHEHPSIEARLHAELASLNGRLPDFAEVQRLDYTRRVITEVLRCYPPGWLFTRSAMVDTALGGHRIRQGSMIVLSPYLLHRDPSVFPDPSRFDPDRWLPERVTSLQRTAWIPFSGGGRKCIGDVMAMTQAVIAMAGIVSRWRLRPAPGVEPRAVAKTVLIPDPLKMVVQPR